MGTECRACGAANRDAARFCAECGAVIERSCGTCATTLPPGARFCDACGAPATDGAPGPSGSGSSLKTVTVVFADLAGSTSAHERAAPEVVREFTTAYYAVMREAVEAHGGRIVKFQGDGVMAVFGVPSVGEDDARSALAAAQAMVRAFDDVMASAPPGVRPSGVRVGVNTGEVVVDDEDLDVVGDAVNVAARLEGRAPLGGVLVGDTTYRLARHHATFGAAETIVVRGRAAPVTARRLLDVTPRRDARPASDDDSPLVGRDDELGQLLDALTVVERRRVTRLVTVLGSPGVGKSRLLAAVGDLAAARATVLAARCDGAGGATFAPVVPALLQAIERDGPGDERDERDVGAITEVLAGVTTEAPGATPEQVFWAVRRAVELLAERRPVLVVLDDAHWAEPLLLDLVEHLVDWLGDVPVLVVVAGRPELRDRRPALTDATRSESTVVALEGLDTTSTHRLTSSLLGDDVPPALAERIASTTDGNPLFVRELVRMLLSDGVVRRSSVGWELTVGIDDVDVPPTIAALLDARLDQLAADERIVLERASVIGHTVYRGALVELLPATTRSRFDELLESLRRNELLEPAGAYWIDEPVLSFHHVLVREAAYRRLLHRDRAALHLRTAEWFERKIGDSSEHDELVGRQLEDATANLRELGPLDDDGVEVARCAGARLAGAAQRALHRDDLAAAASLAARAVACFDGVDAARRDLLIIQCEGLLGLGDVAAARPAVQRLADEARGDVRLEAWTAVFRAQLSTLARADDLAQSEEASQRAASTLESVRDLAGAAKAHRVRAAVLMRLGRIGDAETALDRALTAAREAADDRQVTAVLAGAPVAALWGPSSVTRAGGRCLDVIRLLRITTGARSVEAISMRCQAVLEAFRGRDRAAQKLLGRSQELLEDLGLRHDLLDLERCAGIVHLVAGRHDEAAARLQKARDGFLGLGADVDAAQAAALLARTELARGDLDAALDAAGSADALGGDDLRTAITWRSVAAQAYARQGAHEEAERLARSAVAIADRTDALLDRGEALAALADVLDARGDGAGAALADEASRDAFERKGATALLGSASASTDRPHGATAPPAAPAVGENRASIGSRRSLDAALAGDWETFRRLGAEDLVYDDRRHGLGIRTVGMDLQIRNMEQLTRIGVTAIDQRTVALRGDALALVHLRYHGRDGSFEAALLTVARVDDEDRTTHVLLFEEDDVDGAMRAMHELAVGEPGNRASDAANELVAALAANDDSVPARVLHPEVEFDYRVPTVASAHVGVDAYLDFARFPRSIGATAKVTVRAVRGDELALVRISWSVPGEVAADERCSCYELGEEGTVRRIVVWDRPSELEALEHLDERFAARLTPDLAETVRLGSRFTHAANRRSPVRDLADPDVVLVDHRPGGFGRIAGVDALEQYLAAMPSVTSDYRVIVRRYLALDRDRAVLDARAEASDGFELTSILVVHHHDGRVSAIHYFPSDALDAAMATYEVSG